MANFVAQKPIKVGDEIRQPGELVPEAADWPDIRPWTGGGFVKEISDDEAEKLKGGGERGRIMQRDRDKEKAPGRPQTPGEPSPRPATPKGPPVRPNEPKGRP